MSRTLRHQMPGAAFHVTARTQGCEPWFKEYELEQAVYEIMENSVTTSDALLLALTVMPNHLHVVLRQGQRPLWYALQPGLRRIALLVQRTRAATRGHVFERRFRSAVCENSDHLRRSLVYTHLNPIRKELCVEVGEYRWTSHVKYLSVTETTLSEDPLMYALRLFAGKDDDSVSQLVANYVAYMQWRVEKDRHDDVGVPFDQPEPMFPAGDRHYATRFCGVPVSAMKQRMDLRDRALHHLKRIDAGVNIVELQGSYINRCRYAIRKQLIATLVQDQYTRSAIADFLHVSDTTVSAVASEMRYGIAS